MDGWQVLLVFLFASFAFLHGIQGRRSSSIGRYGKTNSECPEGMSIGEIHSMQPEDDEDSQDREWSFGCIKNEAAGEESDCHWSSWANFYRRKMDFKCPGEGFVSGWKTYFNRVSKDRRHRYLCCKKGGVTPSDCSEDKNVNDWDEELHYEVPNEKFITGIKSKFSRFYHDRRWTFRTCKSGMEEGGAGGEGGEGGGEGGEGGGEGEEGGSEGGEGGGEGGEGGGEGGEGGEGGGEGEEGGGEGGEGGGEGGEGGGEEGGGGEDYNY